MIDFNQIDDLARRLSGLVPPGLREGREELQENFKSVLQSGLSRLDLVTREEFDVQRAVLLREMARFIGEVDAAVQRIDDPLERFVEGFVATLREARDHPLLRRLLEVEPDQLLPALTLEGTPALTLARAYLAQEFRRSQSEGHIHGDVDVDLVAEMLVRLCQSLLLTPGGMIELDDDAGLQHVARAYLAPALFTGRA